MANPETKEAAVSVLTIAYKQLQSAIVSPPRVQNTSREVDWAALVPILQTSERLLKTFEELIDMQSDKWALKNAGPEAQMEYENIQFWMVLLRHALVGRGKLQRVSDNPQA